MVFLFIVVVLALIIMILFFQCFFVNNYTIFVLSVINLTFRGLHDADPSVLVFQDRHRSHLVNIE